MNGHHTVVVVGGGQAGLSMSHCLSARGIDHVVLERDTAGHEWADRRWDSFCLVTPNWQCRLPGFPYPGDDPDGFMVRDEIVAYLRAYRDAFDFPLIEGIEATRLRRTGRGFQVSTVSTSEGELTADHVVLATGPYQVPLLPRMAERLPSDVVQVHSADYRNPEQLPPGEVLVVGTGQSGCQIAEDLHLAGRRVHLAVGSAPRVARRYRGRDVVAWLDDMGYYRRGIDEFADADAVRFRANHYVTGRDGGRDIDLRAFARDGMRLYGRLTGINGGRLTFAQDLSHNLDAADAVSEGIKDSIDTWITAHAIDAPHEDRYVPVWQPDTEPSELDLHTSGITSVVWSTGFGRDHRWIEVPVFDGRGYPTHERGVTSCPGLYFIGLPWQHTWGSGRFCGVADDAEYLAAHIASTSRRTDGLHWIAGTPESTYPADEYWTAPRTVA
ncbi:MSMEG_0569 family flavin-dependent oxidoreductase [Amycolatopsis tucumanensis]|uniref:MSMEG_0569 family flavin-dependent oxidoreductase n=1 Tax=Amycolatopsis tucumanensis TaxID=401106 RepID=A0ABP7HJW3_9PSEU|nr:MSMEG_0569 family flavin-dependent oxidoreductase [Amycolatopsis tucumanensis]MCF6426351.1 MSMEG_0569 family flavin-dependent oxidoreductase [Amycolatopsis tucumanensis]